MSGSAHGCGAAPGPDADVEVFYEQQLDAEARRVAVFPLRDHDTFTTHWRERILANEANYAWTIVADSEVAGNMLCFERDGKREVGYWLGRAYWGRGIATAALAALLRNDLVRAEVNHTEGSDRRSPPTSSGPRLRQCSG